MSRLSLLVVALVALLAVAPAEADNSVHLSRTTSLIGEQLEMTIKVVVPAGATVELTPGTPSWSGVDVVTVKSVSSTPQADGVLWVIEAVVYDFVDPVDRDAVRRQLAEVLKTGRTMSGENSMLRPDGRPHPFQVTMRRLGRSKNVAVARQELPLSFFFFDCLYRADEGPLPGARARLDRPPEEWNPRVRARTHVVPAAKARLGDAILTSFKL